MGAPKNRLLTLTTGIVLSLSLFLLLTLYSVVKSVHVATLNAQKEIKLEMFFKQDLQDPEEIAWIESLKNQAEILKVKIVSQLDAQEFFKNTMKKDWGSLADEASLLSRLPASVILEFQSDISSETRQKIVDNSVASAAQFEKYDGFVFQKDWAQWFGEYASFSKQLALALGAFILLILYFIISNLTRSKITHKAEEIEILSFLGATPWQIEKPFIVKSILLGVFSCFFAIGLVEYSFRFLKTQLLSNAHIFSPDLILTLNPVEMLALLCGVAVLCGIAARSCVQERMWT